MASLFEAPLSLAESCESARERRKRQKHKAKKERRARREQRRGRGAEREGREEAEAQMASGFLAWRDQQEIEGPESWREAGSPGGGEPIALDAPSAGDAGGTVGAGCRPARGAGDGGARGAGSCEQTASGRAGVSFISASLRVEAAPVGSGHLVHVTHFPFTIGRSRRCGFAIDDPKVSAEHCILFHQPGGEGAAFAIQDQSLSGVRVDGAWLPPKTRVPLADGCRISLGKKGRHAFHFCVQTQQSDRQHPPLDRAAQGPAESDCAKYELEDDLVEAGVADAAQDAVAEACRRQELLEPLAKHSWLPPCGGVACSIQELEHYNDLLARSLRKRNRGQSEGGDGGDGGDGGQQLSSQKARKRRTSGAVPGVGKEAGDKVPGDGSMPRPESAGAVPCGAGRLKAWFEPLPRVKTGWGESLPSRPLADTFQPWGVLPPFQALDLGDAWDHVLQALSAKDLCRVAASCRSMRQLVAGSTAWRSLYVSLSKLGRGGLGPQEFARLQMPPDTWKQLYMNLALHKKRTKTSKKGSAGAAGQGCLQCPGKGCGKTFRTVAALHDHLRGAGVNGTRQGPPHHTLVPDGRRHYCQHEFCPRYFPSALLAGKHTHSECKRVSTRCLARRALGEGHFVCAQCQAEFRFQRAFDAHFVTLDGNRRCPTCKDAMGATLVAYEEPHVAETREREERCSAMFEANVANGLQVVLPGARRGSPVTLGLNVLQGLIHMPATEAARSLGVTVDQLTRACKKLGLERWPRILLGFAMVEKELRSSLMEQVTQFAASRQWPAQHAPFRGVYHRQKGQARNASRPWYTKITVMYREVKLGDYHSQVEAAIAFDACMLAYGKPMKGRSGSFVRPAQQDDLNLLSPPDSEPSGVHPPAAMLETIRKLVDAHKREAERAKLADASIRGGWAQDLADAEVSKAREGGAQEPKPSAAPTAAASGARKRRRDLASQ